MSLGLPSTLWWWVNGYLPFYCLMLTHNVLLVYPIQRDVGWDCVVGKKAAFHMVSVWIMGQKMNPAETVLRYPALKTLCMTWVELMGKITTWTYISSKNQLKWVKVYILRNFFEVHLVFLVWPMSPLLTGMGRGLWLVLQPALETLWLHVWGAVRLDSFVLWLMMHNWCI